MAAEWAWRWMCRHCNWKRPIMSAAECLTTGHQACSPGARIVFLLWKLFTGPFWHCLCMSACMWGFLGGYSFGSVGQSHRAHPILWSRLICIQSKGYSPIQWSARCSLCASWYLSWNVPAHPRFVSVFTFYQRLFICGRGHLAEVMLFVG